MIAIVDYGAGNLHSVRHAFERIGADVTVASTPDELCSADRIVLPGVGAFGECVASLRRSGLVDALTEEVMEKGKPLLGICLGMQILAREGREDGCHRGLGWLAGRVERLDVNGSGLKLPHVGWNEVRPAPGPPFDGFGAAPTFYFAHSYHFVAEDPALTAAVCSYGGEFTAAIRHDNIVATQFHPEKSQRNGIRLLENFLAWNP